MKKTLEEIGKETGITKQAVWLKTEKGRAYRLRYQRKYYKKNKEKILKRNLEYYFRKKLIKEIIVKK